MNIVVINQPIGNRGDESAHRAFMRSLVKKYPKDNIKVVFLGDNENDVQQMNINADNVQYIVVKAHKGMVRLARFALVKSVWETIIAIDPPLRKMRNIIKSADVVITAPGGICLGAFHNWIHLLLLVIANLYGKRMAYYSRSFGPFITSNPNDKVFNDLSIRMLKSCDFLSIRDKKTMDIANNLNLKYIPAVDTAFLEKPKVNIPKEVAKEIDDEEYVVFVPNSLKWHPAYSEASEVQIEDFYLTVIKCIIERFPNKKIIMMPQLYGTVPYADYNYFKLLKTKSNYAEKIVVLHDGYGSDIQQTIISKAVLVIGARYHSIVFAINNAKPFISLSYEHKMFGLLSIINKTDCQVDITKLGTASFKQKETIEKISTLMNKKQNNCESARICASEKASACFTKLCHNFIEA